MHLNPIFLTSCLGKLFEHVILARLQTYVDDYVLYPNSMFHFRLHLSAQDVMLQISEDEVPPIAPKTHTSYHGYKRSSCEFAVA